MYNTDVMSLLYYLVCKEVCYTISQYLQIRNISHPTLNYQYSDCIWRYEVFIHIIYNI